MKKSTLILLISTAIFFTSTLVLLYLNYLKPTQTFTPTTGTIPTDTPIPTTNPTADWKSFTDNKLQIQFKYPSKYKLDITQDKNFYDIYLKGTNYRTEANDLGGIMSLGTFFVFSENDLCETTAVPEFQTLILKNNNYSLYKIKGIEGPDYKVAVIKKSSGGCLNFICNTDNLCEGTELADFQSILSTFKFTEPTTSSKEILESSLKKEIYPSSPEKVVIVSTITDNFASGTYKIMLDADGGPGGGWIAAKINNNWKLVEAFQEPPSCNLMKKYNVPISIYGTCINKYTLSEAKSACVALQGQKAWDSNFNECNEAGTTRDQLKKLCDQYGGVFYPDSSTCRHTDFYGLPCGPEATYYCSFANLK